MERHKKQSSSYLLFETLRKHLPWLLVGLLFLSFIFLRFYQLEERAAWGWDQVDFAWNAKKILIDHDYPLIGPVAKGNSGIYIGPIYYYLAAGVYWLTDLHPIASPLLAGIVSICTFFTIFYITKKLFSTQISIIALFIYTFSYYSIHYDRVQWSVNLIVPISFAIFFAIYKILTGSPKYYFLLASMLALSLHVHFTSIFYFIILVFCLPFVPRDKQSLKYTLLSIPLFIIPIVPILISNFAYDAKQGGAMTNYLGVYYHGLHLTRILQVAHDGFIEFVGILHFQMFTYLRYVVFLVFFYIYFKEGVTREKLIFSYLVVLWFVVPWIVFSTYSGEISNYYFSMSRPIAILILSYLTLGAFRAKWYISVPMLVAWILFAIVNLQLFFRPPELNISRERQKAEEKIRNNEPLVLHENAPESYWQWYISEYKK